MNKCDEIKARLADHAVGLLEGRERAEVERHLEGCAACQRELRALQRTGTLLNALPPEEPPPGLWDAVRREIEPAPAREPARAPWWELFRLPRLAYAAAAAAVIVAAIVVFRPQQPLPITEAAEGADYIERHEMLAWNDPLSDKAALGLIVGRSAQPEGTP